MERIRDTGEELVVHDDQQTLLRVTRPARPFGAAHGGIHVLSGGRLNFTGMIRQRLVIDDGGACCASEYIRAIPKVAAGRLLDVTRHFSPVRWPAADIEGTILIAVGTRYGEYVVADGSLASVRPDRRRADQRHQPAVPHGP